MSRTRTDKNGGGIGDPIVIDRRRFLQLATATGIAVAGSASGWRAALGQDESPDMPADADPVAATAAALGNDVDRIFRFVADEVRYEPYAGLLRGPRGTLLARAGNSMDKAALLGAMLAAGGVETRYMAGALDAPAVDALMASATLDIEAARRAADEALVSDADVAAGIQWDLPEAWASVDRTALPDLVEFRDALDEGRSESLPTAAERLEATLEMLTTALAGAGVTLPVAVSGMPDLERSAHAWVQASRDGTWIDLDPSQVGIAAGTTLAGPGEPVEVFTSDQHHLVEIAVIAEALVGGELVREPILKAAFHADQLADSAIVLSHVPAEAFSDLGLIGGIGAGTLYSPVLVVGPEAHVGRRAVSIGGTGGDLFGDALGGGGEGLVEGETSAEWLEVRVTSPGSAPQVARRTMFDRVGDAMREPGALDVYAVLPAEFIDLGDGQGAQFLPCRSIRAMSVTSAPPNVKALVERTTRDRLALPALIPGVFDALRHALTVDLAGPTGVWPLGSVPTVVAWVVEEDGAGSHQTLDILHRSFGGLALAGTGPNVPPAMVAGVIPHVVERLAIGERPDAATTGGASVGSLFEATRAQGIDPIVFADTLPADPPYPPQFAGQIQAALDAGRVVVAPGRIVMVDGRPRLGWWEIDPTTGATVDQMADGGGQVENTVTVIPAASIIVGTAMATGQAVLQRAAPYLNDRNIAAVANRLSALLSSLGG